MKEIIFIRHATAEDMEPEKDILRKLTPRGVFESENIANLLTKLHKDVDLIITSNATRALETADNIQKKAYKDVKRMIDEKLYSGSKNDYLKTLKKMNEKYDSVMIIGHNPIIREVAAYFMDINLYNISFPKASIYSFRVDCDSWKALSNKYSELTLYIKKDYIEMLSDRNKDKKKIEILEKHYSKTNTLIKSLKEEGVRTGYTHDIRINNRKWLSIIDFSSIDGTSLNDIISRFMLSTGRYRDLCVQTRILKKSNEEGNLYKFWNKKKNKKKKTITKEMKEFFKEGLEDIYRDYYHALTEQEEFFPEKRLRSEIEKTLDGLKLHKNISLENDINELHQFRLKVKAARYKLEFFNESFCTYDYDLEDLVFLQKKLGSLRDNQKLVSKIEKKREAFEESEIKNTKTEIEKNIQILWHEITAYLEKNNSFYL